jgi:hypothetical protein
MKPHATLRLRRVSQAIWIFAWSKPIGEINIRGIDVKFHKARDRWNQVMLKHEERFEKRRNKNGLS